MRKDAPDIGLTTLPNLIAFRVLGKSIGFQTSTTPVAARLPVCNMAGASAWQMRVYNASNETAYVEFGDETVEAQTWTGPPPATCSYPIGPWGVAYLTMPQGAEYVSAVLYEGNGGIYFTPGAGIWSG